MLGEFRTGYVRL